MNQLVELLKNLTPETKAFIYMGAVFLALVIYIAIDTEKGGDRYGNPENKV